MSKEKLKKDRAKFDTLIANLDQWLLESDNKQNTQLQEIQSNIQQLQNNSGLLWHQLELVKVQQQEIKGLVNTMRMEMRQLFDNAVQEFNKMFLKPQEQTTTTTTTTTAVQETLKPQTETLVPSTPADAPVPFYHRTPDPQKDQGKDLLDDVL